jgi:hypothetical protein
VSKKNLIFPNLPMTVYALLPRSGRICDCRGEFSQKGNIVAPGTGFKKSLFSITLPYFPTSSAIGQNSHFAVESTKTQWVSKVPTTQKKRVFWSKRYIF